MKFSEPVSTTLPAISICSHCVLCAIKNETLTRTQVEELLRSQQIWRKSTYNQSDLEHFRHSTMADTTIGCWIRRNSSNPSDIIECQHIARPIVSIIYGHKCWTFFADYFGHIRRKLKYNPEQAFLHYDQSPDIIFSVNGRFLSASPIVDYTLDGENGSMLGNGQGFWTNFVDLNGRAHTGLYISIHEPLTLPDLYYLAFYRLKLGTSLYLPFIKRKQTLCPGYNPQCYTYRDDSASPDDIDVNTITEEGKALTSSGLGAYRSRSECYIFCMWRLLNTNRCANFYSSYTSELMDREMLYRFREKVQAHAKQFANWSLDTLQQVFGQDYGMKFCGKSNEGYREYMKAKKICMETCPVSCVVESYTDDVDYVESPLESANGTRIVIKWAAKPVVEVVHRPKLWLSEFLGTLGGTLHIWLKISVIYSIIHVVHFIQSCELLPKASCFRWWFAQKKLVLNKEDS